MDQHVEPDGPQLVSVQADKRWDVLQPAALGRVAGREVEDDVVLRAGGERDCRRGVDKEKGADEAGDASDPVVGDVKERLVGGREDLVI